VLEELKKSRDYTADLKRLLASANICDKRWVFEQYDSMVQTNTVQGPGGEAGVMRIKDSCELGVVSGELETKAGGSLTTHNSQLTTKPQRGIAMALAGNGRWAWLDPKLGAMHAVAEAARKVACTGATPVAATNCLNFGNPEKPEIMAQLSAAIDGIAEACTALGTPITGGNVSLYNETKGEGIYPTPVIGIVGLLEDVSKAVPSGFQNWQDEIVLIHFAGQVKDEFRLCELGSSAFAKSVLGETWGSPPDLDIDREAALHKFLQSSIADGLLNSVADISDGGLAVALARASFGTKWGVQIFISDRASTLDEIDFLFGEQSSAVLISCTEPAFKIIQERVREFGDLTATKLGNVIVRDQIDGDPNFEIWDSQKSLMSVVDLTSELESHWSSTLSAQLAAEVVTA
jgi:phosphoribosylformylglycinamidine synthase